MFRKISHIIISLLLLISGVSFAQRAETLLTQYACTPQVRIARYDADYHSKLVHSIAHGIPLEGRQEISFEQSQWEVSTRIAGHEASSGYMEWIVTCKLTKGSSAQTNVAVNLDFNKWQKSNYLLMPAAAYNGNRYNSRRISYSPKLLDVRDYGKPDMPMIISDVPRLNINEGPSVIQERSGAMTLPSAGFFDANRQQAFWVVTPQASHLGDFGFRIEENKQRNRLSIAIEAPVVRQGYQYFITDNMVASKDKAPDWKAGDSVVFRLQLHFIAARQLQDLYDRFWDIRNGYAAKHPIQPTLPFSACFEVQQRKFNTQNWVDSTGYYSVGMRENFLQDWQIGWTGGMISTYPLLLEGNTQTRQNVIRNFDWLFPNGISPSGFFWDSGEKGNIWYGGDIRKPNTVHWHLVRKSGDGLYYVLRQLKAMPTLGIPPKSGWQQGTRTVANAFVTLWKKYGQLGQFVDSRNGEITVGGSTSGAIVPAALVLAADYFQQPEYLQVAEAIAEKYYTDYVQKGLTTGGPGDALQNPDSESSYAMVESFALLYEATGKKEWLHRGEQMAKQFATWVMAYDYTFPDNTLLGKLKVQTNGAVFANTQNKHGAPGICTHSGIALWRLYRATGQKAYLHLLRDIAASMPQYLSHPARPIDKMKEGWMSERVSTTDWLEGIGELMYGSTWSETALMLSFAELPGVYVQADIGWVCALDHVQARITGNTERMLTLTLHNPTAEVAHTKLWVENSAQQKQPLMENAMLPLQAGSKTPVLLLKKGKWNATLLPGTPLLEKITLQPGETKIIELQKR
jgi:hypothetical protein